MNRKRDLENIGLIYEGYAGINPENIGVSTSSGAQKKAVKGLLRRGYEIHDEYTRKAGGSEIVLVKGENLIKNLGDSEEIVGVDAQGNINGQPYQSYLSDIEEDEQSSAYGQELADEAEDQNPVENYEDEENIEGKEVSFTNAPSLDDIKAGHGVKTYKGKVLKDLGNTVLIDLGNSYAEISKDELDIGDEDAEDLGPNQQPEDWGDEAMGDEQPGETSARFSQDTPDDPASGGGRDIDNPDEEEYDDPYYNREEDLRSRGIDPDAEDPDADEKGKEERNHENEEVKKESFNSHGDRDMSLLAEKYLNIKRYE